MKPAALPARSPCSPMHLTWGNAANPGFSRLFPRSPAFPPEIAKVPAQTHVGKEWEAR